METVLTGGPAPGAATNGMHSQFAEGSGRTRQKDTTAGPPSVAARLGRPGNWDTAARAARLGGQVAPVPMSSMERDRGQPHTAAMGYPKRAVVLYDFVPDSVRVAGRWCGGVKFNKRCS